MAEASARNINRERYLNLMTFRRNGKGVPTPIWAAESGGKLYAVTDGTSAKVKRLRHTDRVRLAPCNARGGVTGKWLDGSARCVDDPALVTRANRALANKYTWQFMILNLVSSLSGRIKRRAIIEISV